MEQTYFDEIHKRGVSPKSVFIKTLLVCACILICPILFIFGGVLGVPLVAGVIYGVYLLFQRISPEYEYIFTTGEIDIDAIYGRQSRRRQITVKPRQIEAMGAMRDAYERFRKDASIQKRLDFSDGNPENTYFMVVNSNQLKKLVLFSPSGRLVEALKPYLQERFLSR